MEFGSVAVALAEGAILAHSVTVRGRKIAKGRVLTADDVATLTAAGRKTVTVGRLGPDDIGEDAAALRLARALVPDPAAAGISLTAPHAGRVNLNASLPGIVEMDIDRLHGLNRVDPSLTFATLHPFTRVTPGTLVGTVKIIAYGVSRAALDTAAHTGASAIRVRPVQLGSAGLILTTADGVADKLAEKGRAAVAARLKALGMSLAEVVTVAHDVATIAGALSQLKGEMALILTAAATSDIRDTAPEAVRQAGGTVARFGMPVDPGNLLFHGTLAGGKPVIGLPGCARSPALNGADWVLERLACGLAVTEEDIAAMGVGGLLKEIPIRPKPREEHVGKAVKAAATSGDDFD
ncbi:MAG: molybdopterin-binding protein [Rhodobacteraceae bacterium]|nr:molybdopterin-binding protein [Paracoccaceae bacterium]